MGPDPLGGSFPTDSRSPPKPSPSRGKVAPQEAVTDEGAPPQGRTTYQLKSERNATQRQRSKEGVNFSLEQACTVPLLFRSTR